MDYRPVERRDARSSMDELWNIPLSERSQLKNAPRCGITCPERASLWRRECGRQERTANKCEVCGGDEKDLSLDSSGGRITLNILKVMGLCTWKGAFCGA